MIYIGTMDSPIGKIKLAATEEALVYCASARESGQTIEEWIDKYIPGEEAQEKNNPIIEEAIKQLDQYFAGERKEFSLPLKLIGTDFRKKVWKALMDIPYGETRSYGQVAQAIGKPKAARAIGQANNKNPISYFVP